MTQNPPLAQVFNALERLGRPVSPAIFARLTNSDVPWHESPEELRRATARARERERLLNWVRSQMLLRLSLVERRCIELYFFEDLNYREAAERLDVNVTSVYRGVERGLRKLRTAARNNPPQRKRPRARSMRNRWKE